MKKVLILALATSIVLSYLSLGNNISIKKHQLQEAQETRMQMQNDKDDMEKEIEDYKNNAASLQQEADKLKQDNSNLQSELDKTKKVAADLSRNLSLSKEFGQKHYDQNTNIYQKSGATVVLLDKALKGTGLAGMGQSFVDAENETGINALFLIGIAIQESGWGTSNFTFTKHNIFGFGAYDNDTKFTVNFSNKEEGVIKVARALVRDYLSPEGQFYHGPTPIGVNVKYCSKSDWAENVTNIMNIICKRIAK